MTQQQQQHTGGDSATIEQPQDQQRVQSHPYLVATITPGGGLIVHMHWMNGPPEPLAFTNEADFSSWLKGAVSQCSQRIPPGIRPRPLQQSTVTHAPLPSQIDEDFEFPQATGPRRGLGARLGTMLGGR
jgi:hypothetical protein